MSRMKDFSAVNPTGDAPGMEPLVRLDVLRAAVDNTLPAPPQMSTNSPPTPVSAPLINKNIRLPADLVEFIDFTYTKDKRMKKQDAYTEALEAFFRPLMASAKS